MSEHNLTPDQRLIPRPVRRVAYKRIPETCAKVRELVDEIKSRTMMEYNLRPEDEPCLDAIVSYAFQQLRDQVSQPFRTEQMRLIHIIMKNGLVNELGDETS